MTLKNRLEEVMEECGLHNQTQLADFLGVTRGLVSQWFDGTTGLGKKPLENIKEKTNFSPRWVKDGTGEKYQQRKQPIPPQSNIVSDDNFDHSHTHLSIPRYEVKLSAGNGTAQWVELTDKEPLIFRASWFFERHLSPEHLRAMTVKGDSMTPVLENGDTVIIDIEDTEIIDGEIYAILYKEKLYIKELRHTENGVLMISKNTDYNAIAVTQHDENRFFVLGRKVWRGG